MNVSQHLILLLSLNKSIIILNNYINYSIIHCLYCFKCSYVKC